MKRKLLLLPPCIVITFVSCKKEDAKTDTTGTQGIQGHRKKMVGEDTDQGMKVIV